MYAMFDDVLSGKYSPGTLREETETEPDMLIVPSPWKEGSMSMMVL